MLLCGSLIGSTAVASHTSVLDAAKFARYDKEFAALHQETITNAIPDQQAWQWMSGNVPLFECPDPEVEKIYYFRWWTFRKHIVKTPAGFVFTEFLKPVSHAGPFNTISCATGFHISEARWLRDPRYVDDYIRFWLRGNHDRPQPHFHKYSSWFAAAAWDRVLVSGKVELLKPLIGDLVRDYETWEREQLLPNGLFWQFDVRDGMEESISGSRLGRNIRTTINSYMFANARAIAALARAAGKVSLAQDYERKACVLSELVQRELWDDSAKFFKVKMENGSFSSAREAIGFVPWMFFLPENGRGFEAAWSQFADPRGFRAPCGITTAERRHPEFRSHGVGTCEWDGAVWPFATSQTLLALANVLNEYEQEHVTRADYFDAFLTYVRSHNRRGKPFIGEYLDEVTGDWIDGKNDRSRHYNHSLFSDLVITGLVGLRPQLDQTIEVNPLIPPDTWDWFCLDGVPYHGCTLTILWDREGTRYGRGQGLRVFAEGREVAGAEGLRQVKGILGHEK
jgi:hypothetical protein